MVKPAQTTDWNRNPSRNGSYRGRKSTTKIAVRLRTFVVVECKEIAKNARKVVVEWEKERTICGKSKVLWGFQTMPFPRPALLLGFHEVMRVSRGFQTADWNKVSNPLYNNLMDCLSSIDSLLSILYREIRKNINQSINTKTVGSSILTRR